MIHYGKDLNVSQSKIKERNFILIISLIIFGIYIRNSSAISTFFSDQHKNNISIILKLLILLAFLYAIPQFLKRFNIKISLIILVVGIFIVLHILIFPSNNIYFYPTTETFLFTVFPGFLAGYFIRDFDKFLDRLIKTSYIVSIINVLFFISFVLGYFDTSNSNYSMGFAQSLIIPTNIMILYILLIKKNKIQSIFSILLLTLNILTILVFGSRGAFVAIIFFAFIIFAKHVKKMTITKKSLILVLSFFLFVFLVFFYSIFIDSLEAVFNFLGISSRTLSFLRASSFFEDNNRFTIWRAVWNDFITNPLLVRGVNSDYFVNTGLTSVNYSHNLFLELLHGFGFIFGSLLIIFFVIKILKTTNLKTDSNSLVRLIFMAGFFPTILWSGSLWTDPNCWIWISLDKKIK